ncbi:MAG: hypothetical protein LBM93_03905 [Oscillospiraceae bacterium]|jgi:hypothetical protein|nr:hypothetical protein [Oscillospiraceae bacterium]
MVYLIDYENVHNNGLKGVNKLTKKDLVIVFFNVLSKKDFEEINMNVTLSEAKVKWIKVEHTGYKNVLDFQLSTYIGYLIGKKKEKKFVIVSKDCGYQSILNFWKNEKKKIKITLREQIIPTQISMTSRPLETEIRSLLADLNFNDTQISDICNRFISNNKPEQFKNVLDKKFKSRSDQIYERLENLFLQHKKIKVVELSAVAEI